MGLSKVELAYVYYRRTGERVDGKTRLDQLELSLGELTLDDCDAIMKLREYVPSPSLSPLLSYDLNDLAQYLFEVTGVKSPVDVSIVSDDRSAVSNFKYHRASQIILLSMYQDYNVRPPKRPLLNDRQREFVEAKGIVLLDGKLGTGKTTSVVERALSLYYNNDTHSKITIVVPSSKRRSYVISLLCNLGLREDIHMSYDDTFKRIDVSQKLYVERYPLCGQEHHIIIDDAHEVVDVNLNNIPTSLAIVGDISRCKQGHWFERLWTQARQVKKVTLDVPYRYKNRYIADVINVQVPSSVGYGERIVVYRTGNTEAKMKEFSSYVEDVIRHYNWKYKDVAIVVLADSIPTCVRRLTDVFGNKVVYESDDIRHDNVITVTDVESVKGREFELVVVYVLTTLDENKYHVALSCAKSMAVVLETNSVQLQPLTSNSQPLTSNVHSPTSNVQLPTSNVQLPTSNVQSPTSDIRFIECLNSKSNIVIIDKGHEQANDIKRDLWHSVSITEVASDANWLKLAETNHLRLKCGEKCRLNSLDKIYICNSNDDDYAVVYGVLIGSYVTNTLPSILRSLCRADKVDVVVDDEKGYNVFLSIMRDNKIWTKIITADEIAKVATIVDNGCKTLEDWLFVSNIISAIFNYGRRLGNVDLTTIKSMIDLLPTLAKELETTFGTTTTQSLGLTFHKVFGKVELVFPGNKVLIVRYGNDITRYANEAILYGALCKTREVYVLNVKDGKIYFVQSDQPPATWKYVLEGYYYIRMETNFRQDVCRLMASRRGKDVKVPWGYALGIERHYYPYMYEIAFVNMSNPYESAINPSFSIRDDDETNFINSHGKKYWTKEEFKELHKYTGLYFDDDRFIAKNHRIDYYHHGYLDRKESYISDMKKGDFIDLASVVKEYLNAGTPNNLTAIYNAVLSSFNKRPPRTSTALGRALAISTIVTLVLGWK